MCQDDVCTDHRMELSRAQSRHDRGRPADTKSIEMDKVCNLSEHVPLGERLPTQE